ncbi:hypothetical protein CYLTODRAFT_416470 [Cylindrobasidium torrendii FP15055 ss-10]|uniref:Uncharacterized protein n=1 Tax=Cylindrobasidium torrendii FP15055 ss-10 TaxID=1314674 RepID=A0A0D7BVM4_9AGAR|nr:hypothetical protein CYLTODRAFT_416470 [Cylindrobasidium torrendii FP15055 ss-10]
MSLKRSRAAYEKDDEKPTMGRQILPVANLPGNYDGEPMDGLEYLFMVRRDARKLPDFTRVTNPFATKSPVLAPVAQDFKKPSHPSLPSVEWRATLLNRFRHIQRYSFVPSSTDVQLPYTRLMPPQKERDLWWSFLSGRPESDWNPPKKPRKIKRVPQAKPVEIPAEEEAHDATAGEAPPSEPVKVVPRALTPTLLQHIDSPRALHLLMYFAHWIDIHLENDGKPFPRIADVHGQWIFFLLTRVDDLLSGDEVAMLRSLARGCLGLLKAMHNEAQPEEGKISRASCWIIISAIIGIWKQEDLWMDAEDTLRSLVVEVGSESQADT